MATEKPALTIIHSPAAIDELHGIWTWNAQTYGTVHADRYLRYLKICIDKLAVEPQRGRPMSARPDLRYILIRRKSRGHGHVAVYHCTDKEVHILHVFHTAQNWRTRL
jgi:plasmid stabilization system protein ParE